jgi:hypothetical protein
MKMKLIIAVLLCTSVSFMACKKEEAGQTTLSLRMTDFPGDWEEVNIDLKEVQVKFDNDSTQWLKLETDTGIYNLLGLQNGIDTLIAKGTFPTNYFVKEIRLIVGPDNTIKTNGETFPLTIPSGAETGLKIKVNKKLQATLETVLIDFDAALSVQDEADGFKLRPVVRVK